MKLYLRVTRDKYELPEAVADSIKELSEMTGIKRNSIRSLLSHKRKGWCRVEFDESEKEDSE